MTVTELREILQKFEAEGKGAMEIGTFGEVHERPFNAVANEPREEVAVKFDDFPEGTKFIYIGW